MANENLRIAQQGKNDEFYTQFHDIEVEMNAYIEYNPDAFRGKTILLPCDDPEWSNFTKFFALKFEEYGIKKLISTSYAPESKKMVLGGLFSEFEQASPKFNADKSKTHGKIFVLDGDISGDGRINIDDLHWEYLNGDGDFQSDEVTSLRDEADIIITNPPFSMSRKFMEWILEADKEFIIIGNVNAITYSQVFPLIMDNKVWLGATIHSGDREFEVPDKYPINAAGWRVDEETGRKFIRVKGIRWFTNIDHGQRHEPLSLMKMHDVLRYTTHKDIKGKLFARYINYDAIEIPYADVIPADYEGVMGVPITFLDKYCPDQFEILGIDGGDMGVSYGISSKLSKTECDALFREHKGFRRGKLCYRNENGKLDVCYRRILIRKK